MDRHTLSELGIKLSLDLDQLANEYNVRSDAYDILSYESATVKDEALDLVTNSGVQESIIKSTLLSAWGNTLASQIPEMALRVREFHEQYHSAKNT